MAVFVQDSFTGTDGTLLENHTPTPSGGAAWVKVSMGANEFLYLYNESAKGSDYTAASAIYYSNISPFSNGYVQAFFSDIAPTNGEHGDLLLRYVDSNNYYIFSLRPDQPWKINKKIAGVESTLSQSVGLSVSGRTLKFEAYGNTLNAYVNGILILTVIDSSLSSGKVGLRANSAQIDSFIAENYAPLSAPTNLTLACGV